MAYKKKFLYVQDGNNDAICWPADRLIGFVHAADTILLVNFRPQTDAGEAASHIDKVTLTITTQTEKSVIKAIVNSINDPYGESMIVLADNVNQKYITGNVTDVFCTLDT